MCEVLGVSRGGFYEWLTRPRSQRSQQTDRLLVQIRRSFESSDRTYGSPRVWRDLLNWGRRCGEKRIARLLFSARLQARRKRRRLPQDLGVRIESTIAPNLLDREFTATGPNQRWVADFTYIWTAEGWLYFAVVLDLYSRRVVGSSASDEMTAQLVTDALIMAVWRRGGPQKLLSELGITCSMSESGDVWDNSAMEGFFSSLKTERMSRKAYRTRDEPAADAFDYVERFYNPYRRHWTIGYVGPADFEKAAELA